MKTGNCPEMLALVISSHGLMGLGCVYKTYEYVQILKTKIILLRLQFSKFMKTSFKGLQYFRSKEALYNKQQL